MISLTNQGGYSHHHKVVVEPGAHTRIHLDGDDDHSNHQDDHRNRQERTQPLISLAIAQSGIRAFWKFS